MEFSLESLITRLDHEYPRAGPLVDGRVVRKHVPNQDSIEASLTDYEILPGIRDFPIYGFGGAKSYYNAQDQRYVFRLAQQIKTSSVINPVIIVEEEKGPYILEGGHRVSALVELKAKSVPALIVIDLESFGFE